MNKLFFLLLIGMSAADLNAQENYVVDNLDLGTSTTTYFNTSTGWHRTYNYPDHINSTMIAAYGGYHSGGFYKDFQFYPNSEYIIYIGIDNYQTTPALTNGGGGITITLANDMIPDPGYPPDFPGSKSITVDPPDFTNKTLKVRVTTGQNESYSKLAIHVSYDGVGVLGTERKMVYDCVSVLWCGHDKTYTAAIESGNLTYDNLYIGSSYASLVPPAYNNASVSTRLTSNAKTIVADNTILSVTSGSSLILDNSKCIPGDYSYVTPAVTIEAYLLDGACGISKPAGSNDNKEKMLLDKWTNAVPSRLNTVVNTIASISPNPATDILNISLANEPQDDGSAYVRIFDFTGKALISESLVSKSSTLDISRLRNGIYLVKVWDGSKFTNQKLVKK